MANADISLLFGVLGEGSLSGESGSLIQSQLNQIMASLNKSPLKVKVSLDTESGGQKSWSSQLQTKLNSISTSGKFSVQVSNITIGSSAIADFKKQLNAVINTMNLDKGTSITLTADGIGEIKSQMEQAGAAATDAARKTAEFKVQLESLIAAKTSVQRVVNTLNNTAATDEERAKIVEITQQYEAWAIKIEEVRASKESISDAYRSELLAEGAAIQENITLLQQVRQATEETANAKAAAANQSDVLEKKTNEYYAALTKINNALIQARNNLKNWTAAQTGTTSGDYSNIQEQVSALESLKSALESGELAADEFNQKYSAATSSIKDSSEHIRAAGENTKTFSDRVGGLASKFTSWLTVSQIIMRVYQALRQMVTAVIDIDTAMTELKKVTDETNATYTSFLETAISRAKELGATVSDTVTATADFARLGYSIDEASQLADAAIVYKNVGDGIEDISEASESIISTMQAFGVAAEDSMLIVDKFNEVGNNFAISSQGIGEALLRSASALAAGNNTLDESIALITTANTIVQNPESVGTAMKTVSMYLRAAKTEAEEAGESTEGMADSVSELRDEILALTGNKVDIQVDDDTFKSTYQIIKEISEVWDELTDITQANLLELLGGKRNSNVVSALIENFSLAEEVIASSADAAGSALAENEKYLDSINGKIAEFEASFQELSATLISSDFVKGVVEFGTGLLDVLNVIAQIIDKVGGLNTVLGVMLGIFIAMNTSSIESFLKNLIKPVQSLIGIFTSAQKAGLTFGQVISNAFVQAATGATALQTALGVVGIALAAISVVVGIAKSAYDALHKSNEELIQDAEDLKSAYSTASEEISSTLSTLRGLEDEFAELSAGVDTYGNNISLASDDYERYREIVSTIVDISPELISGYDAEGNAIANKNELLERAIELMEEEQRLKIKEYVSDDSLKTLLEGEVAGLEETLKSIEIPNTLAYSGVKILEDGELEYGYVNRISEYIERAIGVAFNYEGISNYIQNNAEAITNNIGEILNNAGEDFTDENGNTWKALSESQIADLEEYILSITSAVDSASASLHESLQLIPQTVESYYDLSDAEKDFMSRYISSFDVTTNTTKSDILQIKNEIIDFTNFLASNEDLSTTVSVGIALTTGKDTDGNALTVSEYQAQVQDFLNQIGSYDEETQLIIRTVFGIDEDSTELDVEVDKAIEHVKNLLQDEYDHVVADMTTDEVLQIYYNISAEPNSLTPEDLQAELLETAASYETLSEAVSEVISNIETAQSIIASQASGQSISIADFDTEGMEDYLSALEYVNGTMQLNADKVREITEAKAEEQIAINETNKVLAQSQYIQNARQIEEYRRQLEDATYANGETEESIRASIDALLEENSALAATCKQYDLLSASLREAVGAYQNWLNAQSASDYGDMADDAVSAIQQIRDTYDSESDIFGNFGSVKFDAAVEFIIPDSVDRDDLAAIESYMADFKSYLSFDDDGDVDGLNIDEFLRKSVEAGLMNYSDENGWTIAGQTAMEDFAEGLELSMGVVQAFFDELMLKGAEFDWSDEVVETYGDLAVAATEAKEALLELYEDELTIKIDISDIETTEEQLSTLDDTIAEMNDIKSKVDIDSSEIEYANLVIRYCVTQKQLLTQPDVMRVDTSQVEGDIGNVLLLLQQFQEAQNNLETLVAVGADTSEAEATLNSLAEKIQSEQATFINCGLEIDTTSIDTIQQFISDLSAEAIVTLGVDATAVEGYDPETKTCTVIYDPDTDLLPESFGPYEATVEYVADLSNLPTSLKTLTRYVNHVAIGDVGVNGTAHVGGTAKASGDWGTARGGSTLVGELGREIVVDPRTGRWYTVGDKGAEFVHIPAGAIVFNHKQTESLLEYGYVAGRASALVSGTAMVTGGYKPYTPTTTTTTTTSTTNSNSSATLTVEAELDSTDLEDELEDLLDEMSEKIDEIIGDFEHEIFLLEKNGGTTEEIVAIYRAMQEAVHEQAEEYRALGLDENSDYIQELQKQWWDYQDSIQEAIVSSYETIIAEWENAIELTENLLENAISNRNMDEVEKYTSNIIAYYKNLQAKVHEEAEYYRSLGYSDTSDEVSKLSDLWWEYANNIIDAMNRVVEAASDAVDQIQDVYDTLHNAADEFADGGYITVDTLQDIIDMGVQYMQLLTDENGQLAINEERINAVIAARTEQLALESALNYVERLRLALQAGSVEELNNLLYATTQTTDATWGLVYANLALLNLDSTQYQAALNNINALRSLAQNAISGIGQVSNSTSEALEEMKSGLDDILDYVMEMLKKRINDQIEALEEMKDAYRDIINLRKEALKAAKEEADYQDEVASKIQEIAKLQERINALSLDDSREAQAQKAQLEEEMYELQKELADTQADYALEAQEDALDDMLDAYEAEKDAEIAVLEDTISSYQKLYDMAIAYIESNWDTLYSELIAWNTQYGTVLNSTITEAWDNALAAAQRYGSYVSALNNISADIDSASGTTHNDTLSSTTYDSSSTNEEMVTAIVYQMKQLSSMWDAENNTAERNNQLHEQAVQLAALLDQYGVHAEFESGSGIWWVTKDELNPENVGKQLHSVYHEGGIAGDNPTLKQNEVLAVLEKGEAILDEQKEKGLFRLIDFATSLSDAFSALIDSTGYDQVFGGAQDGISEVGAISPISNNSNSVQFGDVYIYGSNDETIEKHREINRKFTNEILKNLNIKSR